MGEDKSGFAQRLFHLVGQIEQGRTPPIAVHADHGAAPCYEHFGQG
jgi:hypothetical protein